MRSGTGRSPARRFDTDDTEDLARTHRKYAGWNPSRRGYQRVAVSRLYSRRGGAQPSDRRRKQALARDRSRLRRATPIAVLVLALAATVATAAIVLRGPVRGATLPDDGDASRTEQPDPDLPFPRLRHIYLVVLENHDFSAVIGDRAAPFLNGLANRYGLATNHVAVARPS